MVPDRKSRSPSSRTPRGARRSLLAALCLAAFAGPGDVFAQAREDWYLAAHDHRETGLGVMVVTLDDGSRWIRVLDLKLLELPVPDVAPRVHAGEDIVPLASLGLAHAIDEAGGRLHLFERRRDTARAPIPDENLILDIVVNDQALAAAQVARRTEDGVLLSRETLALARLAVPAEAGDAEWVPLEALAGDHYVLDLQSMRLAFTARPDAFVPTHLRAGGEVADVVAAPAPAPLSAILGYDVVASRASDGSSTSSFLFDAAISRGRVVCRDRHLWRSGQSMARLETACHADWPERRLTFTLGDAVSRDSSLSPPVRYGGVRIGTDFALQPGLQTQPLLGIEGSARLPSLLEVWIEQQLALRTEIPPGQFLVDGIPARTGRGLVTAVITDALGRHVLVDDPFYSDPRLLRPGLADWALEFGRLREGFLTRGDHYAEQFALFSWRRGLSPYWTVEARAEWQPSHRLAGLSNFLRLGDYGVLELSAARSAGISSGDARAVGYGYQGRRWNIGFRYATYDDGYRDLGFAPGEAPVRDAQASAGLRIGRVSLSAGAMLREDRELGERRLARAAMSMPIGEGYFSLSALRPLDGDGEPLYSALYTLPLSGRRSLSSWIDGGNGAVTPGIVFQKSLPAGPGTGYRLLAEDSPSGFTASGEGVLRNDYGQFGAVVRRTDEGTAASVQGRGAVVLVAGDAFLAPDDGGSFALVRMQQPDALILREHQDAATTGRKGTTLVPGLRPFDRNRLSVAPESLDPSTRIETQALELVPGRRQVVVAAFGASRVTPLTLRVRRPDGAAPPTGALVEAGNAAPMPLGHEGLLYVEFNGTPQDLVVTWPGAACTIAAAALPDNPDPARIYEATCR